MGIRGLTSLIKQTLSSFSKRVNLSVIVDELSLSPPRPVIIVDGIAFVYYCCGAIDSMSSSFGTNYEELFYEATKLINSFMLAGFELIFVFDGYTPINKFQTKLLRLKKQYEDLEIFVEINMTSYCDLQEGESIPLDILRKCRVLSLLSTEVIIECLKALNISILYAEEEADQLIAKAAIDNCAFAILSNDSDFLAFDIGNTGFLPIWSLDFSCNGSIYANIIHRSNLASHLKIASQVRLQSTHDHRLNDMSVEITIFCSVLHFLLCM